QIFGDSVKVGPGSLFINGTLYGNMNVLQGLFGGTGVVAGNLYNNSIVAPGDAPGTLHLSGNYFQASNALLQIGIGGRGAGQIDVLSVSGVANLKGGLQLIPLNGYKLKRNQPITFLTAGQGIDGKFAYIADGFT